MIPDALYASLNGLRGEYRKRMNDASDAAVSASGDGEMDKVSLFSTESERMREAFNALNRAIRLVEEAFSDGEGLSGNGALGRSKAP
jgi:hypothetical protein